MGPGIRVPDSLPDTRVPGIFTLLLYAHGCLYHNALTFLYRITRIRVPVVPFITRRVRGSKIAENRITNPFGALTVTVSYRIIQRRYNDGQVSSVTAGRALGGVHRSLLHGGGIKSRSVGQAWTKRCHYITRTSNLAKYSPIFRNSFSERPGNKFRNKLGSHMS